VCWSSKCDLHWGVSTTFISRTYIHSWIWKQHICFWKIILSSMKCMNADSIITADMKNEDTLCVWAQAQMWLLSHFPRTVMSWWLHNSTEAAVLLSSPIYRLLLLTRTSRWTASLLWTIIQSLSSASLQERLAVFCTGTIFLILINVDGGPAMILQSGSQTNKTKLKYKKLI